MSGTTVCAFVQARRTVLPICLTIIAAAGPRALGDDPALLAFSSALEKQQQVLLQLDTILREEEVTLSDGAVLAALQSLLQDENRQVEGIRALGKRTLGKTAEELAEADKSERDKLANHQDACHDRYRRVVKMMETKSAASMDSPFTQMLKTAEDLEISQHMEETAKLIRENQLGRAFQMTNELVTSLNELIKLLTRGGEPEIKQDKADGAGFTAPSLAVKDPNKGLPQFDWGGGIPPAALGRIFKSLRQMEDLVRRQNELVAKLKVRAPMDKVAEDLAAEQAAIRSEALEATAPLLELDPALGPLVRQAADSMDKAESPMKSGPLSDAIEPAQQAADELAAAFQHLRDTWKMLLALIKDFTQKAEFLMNQSNMQIPHGMSEEAAKEMERIALLMLRATAMLAEAIKQQTALVGDTTVAQPEQLPPLRPRQEEVSRLLIDEVLPNNVAATAQPAAATKPEDESAHTSRARAATASDLLNDALLAIGRAVKELDIRDRTNALKSQQQALDQMTEAMQLMVAILQKLLGQLKIASLAMENGAAGTVALDPSGRPIRSEGWSFDLPPRQREAVRQAFRGSFPQRYDRAIKNYYQAIAREKTPEGQ